MCLTRTYDINRRTIKYRDVGYFRNGNMYDDDDMIEK